uniref:Uncharacterized protein n=1 Tax=Colobus angolensis palliatus TaxID=336983 RepID=A0A2K5K584_COLAP
WFIRGAGEAEKFSRALFGWVGARPSALCASSTPQLSFSGRGARYFRLGEVLETDVGSSVGDFSGFWPFQTLVIVFSVQSPFGVWGFLSSCAQHREARPEGMVSWLLCSSLLEAQ